MNTILETFEETSKANRKECESQDAEMSRKAKAEERKKADAEARLEKERSILAGMMADYARIEGELTAAASKEIEARTITAEQVQAGSVSLDEFLKAGKTVEAIKKQAAEETAAKLADVMKLIREKRARIFELEFEAAEAAYNLAYCAMFVPRLRLEKLKQEVDLFSRSLNPVYEGYMAAGSARNTAEMNFQHAQGKGHTNLLWDHLTFAEIQDLRFDPRIPEAQKLEIEEFLLTADPDETWSGVYCVYPPEGGKSYIRFREAGGPRAIGGGRIAKARTSSEMDK